MQYSYMNHWPWYSLVNPWHSCLYMIAWTLQTKVFALFSADVNIRFFPSHGTAHGLRGFPVGGPLTPLSVELLICHRICSVKRTTGLLINTHARPPYRSPSSFLGGLEEGKGQCMYLSSSPLLKIEHKLKFLSKIHFSPTKGRTYMEMEILT